MDSSGNNQIQINKKDDLTPNNVTSYIMLRKKQVMENNNNNSVIYLDNGSNNKIAFTLKNEREFFIKENVDVNIKKLRSKFTDEVTDLNNTNKQINILKKGKNNTLESLDLKTVNDDNSHIKFIKEKEDPFGAMIKNENNTMSLNNNMLKKDEPIFTKVGDIQENMIKLRTSI
jgi:hypothetical protein